MLPKRSIRRFVILCEGLALLCLCACSGTKSMKSAAASGKADTSKAVARAPVLVPAEEMLFSEVAEFVDLGQESMQDSLWFQAGEDFDSALVRLSGLEATDSLSPSVYSMVKVYRDSVQKLLITTVAMTSQMSQPAPLTEQFDEEMEEVSDSSVHAIDSIVHYIDPKAYDLPLPAPLNNRILQAISVFMGPGKGYFAKWLSRKPRYEGLIRKKLEERGMPRDLMYLAMVESGFNPKAWSKASASGMWQFISGTGRRYGLMDDWWFDPRRDPLMATDAALDYLADLHDEFGDWDQAMAAYNCGEGRIRKYREKDSTMSYWRMPLPKETQFYVPKILAAMIIGHNPQRYGFVVDHPETALDFDTVTVHNCLSIGTIAKAAGTTEDSIISLNPALRRWCTPPNKADYMVHVPTGTRDLFLKNYQLLDKTQLVNWHHHVVGKGENLSGIATRYHVSVAAIKATNKIKGSRLHRGQSLLIPLAPSDAMKYSEADVPESPKRGSKFRNGVYKVRSGDNLFDIARRFNMTVGQLLAANNLRSGATIRPGQRLRLGRKSAAQMDDDPEIHEEPKVVFDAEPPAARPGARPRGTVPVPLGGVKYQIYTVAANDNLFTIAQDLGVGEDDLRKWNGIRGNRILAGQRLKYIGSDRTASGDSASAADPADAGNAVPTAVASTSISVEPRSGAPAKHPGAGATPHAAGGVATGRKVHLVKAGENLYQIAREQGTDYQSIMAMNGLEDGAQIFPGDSLIVAGGPGRKAVMNSPGAKTALEAEAKAGGGEEKANGKSDEKQYYVVKDGDSLWDISVRYRTTVQKLKELNGRMPPVLKSGVRIRVK